MARKQADGAGSIRKRTDGRYEVRCTIGYDPGSGKRISKSAYAKSKKEAREKLTELTRAVDQGTFMESSRTTLGLWLDEWLETYSKGRVKPYTYDTYFRIIRNHIKPALGAVRLCDLTGTMLQRFYNSLLRDKNLSPKMLKNVNGILHQALQKAVRLEMISRNPTDACELPHAEKPKIHPLEQDEIVSLLLRFKTHRFGNLYFVTLFSGMRQGEVLGLTWDCVDFGNRILTVNKQLQKSAKVGGEYVLAVPKNKRSRDIRVADSVMDTLRKQREWQEKMKALCGEAWQNPWNLVFTNETGSHLAHVTVYKGFKDLVTEMGIPNERFHDLRHTFATLSLENGDDLKTVQENLGHATAAFTMDVYGHVSQRMRRQSAERMEAFIRGAS